MFEPDPRIRVMTTRGYRVAIHSYFRSDRLPKHTVVATHDLDGAVIQGWGPTVIDAVGDLWRRVGGNTVAVDR